MLNILQSRLATRPRLLEHIHDTAIILVSMAALFWWIAPTIADPDLWGHVKFGQDILVNGGVVRHDPYSYTAAGAEWINHEWLSEVSFALAYDLAGPSGLIALKLVICFTVLGIIYAWLRSRGVRLILIAIVLLASSILLRISVGTVRPQLYTLLLFALTLLCLASYEAGRRRSLLALPVLFALWVNFHGGVLAGAAVVIAWAGARSLARLLPLPDMGRFFDTGHRHELGIVVASLLATLLNPYGHELPLFLLRTGTVARPEITEWQPLPITSAPGAIYIALVALSLVTLWVSRCPKRPGMLLVYAILVIAPLSAVRHLSLFTIGFALAMGDHLASAWERWRGSSHRATGVTSARFALLLSAASLAGAVVLLVQSLPRLGCIAFPAGFYPPRAVEIVGAAVPRGNMAVHFIWGEYAIWQLGPEVRVSMDGRRETVYAEPAYEAYISFVTGKGDWERMLREHPSDVALVRRIDANYNLLSLHPHWELVYQDGLSAIFAPPDRVAAFEGLAERFAHIPHDGAGMCFE